MHIEYYRLSIHNHSSAGSDYLPSFTRLTFGPSSTRLCVSVPIIDNDIPERNESFSIVMVTDDETITIPQPIAFIEIKDNDNNGMYSKLCA